MTAHSTHPKPYRTITAAALGAAVLAVTALSGCSILSKDASGSGRATPTDGQRVIFIGDSTASTVAPALEASVEATGGSFLNKTSDGGGNLVTADGVPPADETWKELEKSLSKFKPTTVIYQIALYDWGTARDQRTAYKKLVTQANQEGAKTVFVTAPPNRDEFFDSHRKEMASATAVAKQVAESTRATFLDAGEVWGTDPTKSEALRSPDGEHNCQQGAAKFTVWIGKKLEPITGVKPADAKTWAQGAWTSAMPYSQFNCPANGK